MSRIEKGTQRFRPAMPVRGDPAARHRTGAIQRAPAPPVRRPPAEQSAAPARSYAFGASRASRVSQKLTAHNVCSTYRADICWTAPPG